VKRRKQIVFCSILIGILTLVAISPFGCAILSVFVGMGGIRAMEARLQKPEMYEPVASNLALYCQSDQKLFPGYIGYSWFPPEIRKFGHGWGSITTNSAHIEFGGGFYHYGYRLELDPGASTGGTNVWQFFLYGEGSGDKHLTTLAVPATNTLPRDSLLKKVVAGYDERLLTSPKDAAAHQGKIQLLLRFNEIAKARAACKDMLSTMPDDWWAQLVNALVLAEEKSSEQAVQALQTWVQKNPNFFSCLDLAYYHQLRNEPTKAAQAMIKATEYDANTTWGHGGNSEFRGYTAAMYAFENGEYDAVLKLCDKLAKVTINGNYAKTGLQNLRSAAERGKRGRRRL
jgi:tetratricopeptide (TPR) repeat protein